MAAADDGECGRSRHAPKKCRKGSRRFRPGTSRAQPSGRFLRYRVRAVFAREVLAGSEQRRPARGVPSESATASSRTWADRQRSLRTPSEAPPPLAHWVVTHRMVRRSHLRALAAEAPQHPSRTPSVEAPRGILDFTRPAPPAPRLQGRSDRHALTSSGSHEGSPQTSSACASGCPSSRVGVHALAEGATDTAPLCRGGRVVEQQVTAGVALREVVAAPAHRPTEPYALNQPRERRPVATRATIVARRRHSLSAAALPRRASHCLRNALRVTPDGVNRYFTGFTAAPPCSWRAACWAYGQHDWVGPCAR